MMSPMKATLLHHVSFPVSDLARARRFYEDVLGVEEIERPDLGRPGIWYRAGATEIHLIETPQGVDVGSRAPGLNPLGPHTAFAIEDYESTLSELRERGIEVLETNADAGQMWIRDPDGNLFELIVPRG